MKYIFSLLLLVSLLFFGCKTGIKDVKGGGGNGEGSTGTGVNTSRSNIKNDVEPKNSKTKEEKKK